MEFDLEKLTPDVRRLNDMREVLADKNFAENSPDMDLYYMYRNLEIKDGLRYDITIIPAKMLGSEFTKTKGHNHAGFYGEIYIVLEGEGFFLFQKGDENIIEDVCVVHGKKGDVIKIPAGYGHVTINPSNQELKMANWVKEEDKGSFSLFEKMQGACYYYVRPASAKGFGEGTWQKNENYKQVPELRFENPLKEIPQDLNFLKQ